MNWIIKDVRRPHRTLSIDNGSIRPHNHIFRSLQRIFCHHRADNAFSCWFLYFFPSFSFWSRPISFNRSFRLLLLHRVHIWLFKHIPHIEILKRRKQKQQLSTSPHYLSISVRCVRFTCEPITACSTAYVCALHVFCVWYKVITRSHTCKVLTSVYRPFYWSRAIWCCLRVATYISKPYRKYSAINFRTDGIDGIAKYTSNRESKIQHIPTVSTYYYILLLGICYHFAKWLCDESMATGITTPIRAKVYIPWFGHFSVNMNMKWKWFSTVQ